MKTANGAANGKAKKNGAGGKFDFTPTDFDRDGMPPAFPAGEWTAKLVTAKIGATKLKADGSGGAPMVTVEFKITGTENKKHKKLVGTKQRAWLVMPPKGASGERMMKLNLRDFCQNFDIELDTLPTGRVTKKSQFSDFLAACKGVEGTIWTVLEDRNGEETTSIKFKAPAAGKGAKAEDEDDEEDEDTTDAEEDEDDDEEESDDTEDSNDDDDDDSDDEDEDDDEDEEEERPVVRGKKPAIAAKGKGKAAAGKSARA
jgi:hypothetical protein